MDMPAPTKLTSLRERLALRGIDGVTLLVLPSVIFTLAIFIYPFIYGLILSFQPINGTGALANYIAFFSDPFLYNTIWATLRLSLPATIVSVLFAIPLAMRVRLMKRQRLLTTILVLPITLGTVLIAEGMLNYLGPQGWLNRTLLLLGLIHAPLVLVLSLIVTLFPFTFLLTLSFVTGIDPALERAAAIHGASSWQRFRHVMLPLLVPGLAIGFCLTFVQAFAVFPSAVLLGAPQGPTRVISIAAAQAAFEQYDFTMASAIAMIMGVVQLAIVVIVLVGRTLFYRGATSGGKG